MDGLINLDNSLHVFTRAPNQADLRELSCAGMRSVVNLRAPGENGEVLAPGTEGEVAAKSGLAYLSFPVTPADLTTRAASTIRVEMEQLPTPIAIHCASGKRQAG
ncbi:sulfur transferase domain-containing protein [Qipengyuania sp. DY56-A-20]|uniref:Sulfur transferase domain-containing protein n=1 Tax=Qipengyuania benthica TaxID=3067651 RepID=A0ABT9HAU0_9SPHN|nr:sulfur transferase domain-containing protein [Qipengyuania sp. DY56-A-20]MDP4540434.1 sulfur transferase domain-containing protein [Qipengyuania sp. DY56-A-20]